MRVSRHRGPKGLGRATPALHVVRHFPLARLLGERPRSAGSSWPVLGASRLARVMFKQVASERQRHLRLSRQGAARC